VTATPEPPGRRHQTPPAELVVSTDAAANGGSCVARHEGRVIFVRYALPGERVRVRITGDRGSYWHAEAFEILEPSPDRVDSLCPIAGVDGSGCCDLAFADPRAARKIKGQVVANQLERLGDFAWQGAAQPVDDGAALGWRTRVRLDVGSDRRAGFHRYHSTELVTDLRCGQLPAGMLDGLDGPRWQTGEHVHVVLDDDGARHVVATSRQPRRTRVIEGANDTVQRVGQRAWQVPVTGFWQAHRAAAPAYSALVAEWTRDSGATTAWDLYGGAGVFAAALADVVGAGGRVLTVDTSRAASRSARAALADLPQVEVITESVRRALQAQQGGADVAVLDPPRSGAGREVVELLAAAGVPRVIHVGCGVEALRVFDSFPLTHHVECIALLTR